MVQQYRQRRADMVLLVDYVTRVANALEIGQRTLSSM